MSNERNELKKRLHPEIDDMGEVEFDGLNNELCLATAYHTLCVKRARVVALTDEAAGFKVSDGVANILAFGEERSWMIVRSGLMQSVRQRIIQESPKARELGDDFMVWAGLSEEEKQRVEGVVEMIVCAEIPFRSVINMPGDRQAREEKVAAANQVIEEAGFKRIFFKANNERELDDLYKRHFRPQAANNKRPGCLPRIIGYFSHMFRCK